MQDIAGVLLVQPIRNGALALKGRQMLPGRQVPVLGRRLGGAEGGLPAVIEHEYPRKRGRGAGGARLEGVEDRTGLGQLGW